MGTSWAGSSPMSRDPFYPSKRRRFSSTAVVRKLVLEQKTWEQRGGQPCVGNRPNTVSESTVSNTELSEFLALTEFWGESSVSSFRQFAAQSELTEFFAELTEFTPKLSEAQ